ncbi:hypothetical protein Moror_5865 [Moniliophthora roreri MCA 2997]|uniref:Uncharacterized protein n=1 Tax=Moniliophthora roreri (strain MCA 2997) TaxID=1381753 RepID=V2Y6B1_MONRO|nr:hypothetical protein Moror_5865 [Moniliophthora roreri MCA 2997]
MLLSTTKLKLLSGIIVLLSITQFAGAIGTSVGVKKITKFSNFGQYSVIPGYLWIFGATLADILIAVTMVYAVRRNHNLPMSCLIQIVLYVMVALAIRYYR